MGIAELFRELLVIAYVEIVVALLPEVLGVTYQAPRDSLLQRFERIGELALLGFAEQQMNMLRHDDISVDTEAETPSDVLQSDLKDLLRGVRCKEWTAVVATERHEVTLSGFVISR